MTLLTENGPATRATTSPDGKGQYIAVTPDGVWLSTESPEDLALQREEAAFTRLRPMLGNLHGQFVAIFKGAVADHDFSKNILIQRFVADHPGATVYIDFVGDLPPARIHLGSLR